MGDYTDTTPAPLVAPKPICHHRRVTKTAYLRVYAPDVKGSDEPVPRFVRSYGILSEGSAEGHWVAEWKGRRLVCPRNLRLRVLESTIAFANAFQGMGAGLIPEDAARAADRELRAYLKSHPSHRSHVLTSAWHVPVRWFVAFDPEEREVYDGPKGPRLRFRTDIEAAKGRVEHAHGVLEGLSVLPGPAEELEALYGWLRPFPDGSMVELDYGEVSELFDPSELVFDNSCELVRESVLALENGDLHRAGELYALVVTRWAPAFAVTFSN